MTEFVGSPCEAMPALLTAGHPAITSYGAKASQEAQRCNDRECEGPTPNKGRREALVSTHMPDHRRHRSQDPIQAATPVRGPGALIGALAKQRRRVEEVHQQFFVLVLETIKDLHPRHVSAPQARWEDP